MKKCPQCAEEVQDDAKVCRYCSYKFSAYDRADQGVRKLGCGGAALLAVLFLVVASQCSKDDAGPNTVTGTPSSGAGPGSTAETARVENWSYSTVEDKVRGAKSYFASTTSTNTIRQDFPYDKETSMTLSIRKSPSQGTDVMLTVSSGQMMCPSYQGCSGTVSFDGGAPQPISMTGPSDNSNETVFISGAKAFLSKLKRAKKVAIEKTLYQAGEAQFEFNVAGLKWEH